MRAARLEAVAEARLDATVCGESPPAERHSDTLPGATLSRC
jgi:hypothetical protein